MPTSTKEGFATKAIHAGQDPLQWTHCSVIPPIVMSTTYRQDGPAQHRGFEYGRSGNPTRTVLETCLAAIENGKHGLAFSSGLGATTALASLLGGGDHIVCCDDVYGGTNRYFRTCLSKNGIGVTFTDATSINNVVNSIRPNTKMIWLETPTNPLLKIIDIKAVIDTVKAIRSDIITVVDNSFVTCYFQKPLDLGADFVVYSLSKYMNGHSDVIMGAAITQRDDLEERLRYIQNALGIVPSPFDCQQVNRSLKTLEVRMEKHMANGLAVAKFLESHPRVEKVFHPFLPSHPQHELAKKQQTGHSGMVTFYIKDNSHKFLKALKIFTLAESLGGYESLAELPSVMTHASLTPEARDALGINDKLIRLSVGLETEADLIADLDQALKASQM
ncbi:cystathionine gamma-lyase [Diachasma alloeum]|uniref:cystathionine gamma-lyase n=1 Tax=Diachasma alloeum TaxID=454923 RepID=UPI0007380F8C|nr:cystathionine gamma-lyase [Diachasma alloeum]XP_015109660.1 cystathionine gamma-lyase [Diachasma alloeum]